MFDEFRWCRSDSVTGLGGGRGGPHHNASNQKESPVLSSEFITYLDTLLHVDKNEDTYIPTTDQALLRRSAPPTTQASDRVRPAPPEFVEHLI